jgi:hypothetical protein
MNLRTMLDIASLSEGPPMPDVSKEVGQMKRDTLILQKCDANNFTFYFIK